MRTAVLIKWDGVTPEIYRSVKETVNWEGVVPRGAVFHVAMFDQEGIRTVDIWESDADFNDFVAKRLLPGAQNQGVTGLPQIELFPVYDMFEPAHASTFMETFSSNKKD